MEYPFKTKPYDHQLRCWRQSKDLPYFAFFFEMGCGKSKTTIDTIAYLYDKGQIDSVCIVAPKGVYRNWVQQEFAKHLPEHIDFHLGWYDAAGHADARDSVKLIFEKTRLLRIFVMNVESLATTNGFEITYDFLTSGRSFLAIDESTTIKNYRADRTMAAFKLRSAAAYRRILCGDPYANSPLDIWAQSEFLEHGVLGPSFTAFKTRYAKLETAVTTGGFRPLNRCSESTLCHMARALERYLPRIKAKGRRWARFDHPGGQPDDTMTLNISRLPKTNLILLVERLTWASGGKTTKMVVGFQGLEDLRRRVDAFSFTVKKDECLDLPPKIFLGMRVVEMTKSQRRIYEQMSRELYADIDGMGQSASAAIVLTKMLRLQQITAGFVKTDDGHEVDICKDKNPRLQAMLDAVEEAAPQKVIIWTHFTYCVNEIRAALAKVYGPESVVVYDGHTSDADRDLARRSFQDLTSPVRFFIGNQATGGRGIDLFAAGLVLYYTQAFDGELRKNSEDRAHRIGLSHKVVYQDIGVPGTVDDEKIVKILQDKAALSAMLRDSSWKTLFDV